MISVKIKQRKAKYFNGTTIQKRGFDYVLSDGKLYFNVNNKGSLSTVVGDEKLTSREDLIGLLFLYVQSDEDTFLKVDEVSKTEAQPFDVFNQLVSRFQFCV